MFQKLANHNGDLKRLLEKGYACSVDGAYLVVRDIPYLDDQGSLKIGAFVTDLEFVDKTHVRQKDHQVDFAGGMPHGLDGKLIPNLGSRDATVTLGDKSRDVAVQRRFSNKPKQTGKFADFFEKIESYTTIVAGPAIERFGVSPFTFRECQDGDPDPLFYYVDTLTSRARIDDLSKQLEDDVVAVIGLGGTGGYILDFLTKCRVKGIRGFDSDQFRIHNAYRSPGRLTEAELGTPKTQVWESRYSNFRRGMDFRCKAIDATCADDMAGVTFAFVCVDKGSSRSGIFDLLLALRIPFIDVGIGLSRKRGPLSGMARVTYYSVEDGGKVRDMQLAELSDGVDAEYRTNVQIAELNALNACLAVIEFKKLRGFYLQERPIYHALFEIGDLSIASCPETEAD